MARAITARRTQDGLATELVVYPDAGHALGGDGTAVDPSAVKLGGTLDAITRDRIDAWRRTRAFLATALASGIPTEVAAHASR